MDLTNFCVKLIFSCKISGQNTYYNVCQSFVAVRHIGTATRELQAIFKAGNLIVSHDFKDIVKFLIYWVTVILDLKFAAQIQVGHIEFGKFGLNVAVLCNTS